MGWPEAITELLTELLVIFGDIIYLSHEGVSYLNTQAIIVVIILKKLWENIFMVMLRSNKGTC